MYELYRNIKRRRIELGMTQEVLKERMKYKDKASISRIERGQVDLPYSKIEMLASILEISVPELLGYGTLQDAETYTSVRTRTTMYLSERYGLPDYVVGALKGASERECLLVVEMLKCVRKNIDEILNERWEDYEAKREDNDYDENEFRRQLVMDAITPK